MTTPAEGTEPDQSTMPPARVPPLTGQAHSLDPEATSPKAALAGSNAAWREKNYPRYREMNAQWRRNNIERSRELNRKSSQRIRDREKKRKKRNARQRDYYAANADRLRTQRREFSARRLAEDPVGYTETRRARQRAWQDRNREKLRAYNRARYAQDPLSAREYARDYYRQHREHLRAQIQARREKYKQRTTDQPQNSNAARARRRKTGLPPRKLHRTPRAERQQNARDADAFFARTLSPDERTRVLKELHTPTPPHLIHALIRHHARIRAAQYLATMPPPPPASPETITEQVELARMDEIARRINEILRTQPRERRPLGADPMAPHQMPGAPNHGLSR